MERSTWQNGETIVGQVVHALHADLFTPFTSITEIQFSNWTTETFVYTLQFFLYPHM